MPSRQPKTLLLALSSAFSSAFLVLPARGATVADTPIQAVTGQIYTILTDRPCQTIEHFGASDAWSMQTIGLWSDEGQQRQIADWLFSTENDDNGQPRGIGLSVWRFNLGAGSAYQGDSSYINKGTRTECFLQPDGTYDWSAQAGQVKFLRMAKERGVPRLLAFLNSPPVYFTQNGLATNTGRGGTLNLRPDCYGYFARFMAEAVAGLEREHGLHIDYLCPVNEPDGSWNWQGPKQEGSPATNREIARLVRTTSRLFAERGLTTQVLFDESSDLRCLLDIHDTSWERGHALNAFFTPDSTDTYLGDLPLVPRTILAHSYWTNTPVRYMKRIRQQLRDSLRRLGADFWQSEICIMQNDEEIGGGGGYDFTMKTGLYVARIIHHDLCYADARSWSWWRACGGNYKDGLIRIYDGGDRRRDARRPADAAGRPADGDRRDARRPADAAGRPADGDRRDARRPADGEAVAPYARDSRLLWCLGNYSRFVRPGAVRYEVRSSVPEDPYGVMLSAYRNADGTWVVVAINYSDAERPIALAFAESSAAPVPAVSAPATMPAGSPAGLSAPVPAVFAPALVPAVSAPAPVPAVSAPATTPAGSPAGIPAPRLWQPYRTSDREGETLRPLPVVAASPSALPAALPAATTPAASAAGLPASAAGLPASASGPSVVLAPRSITTFVQK